MKIKKSILDKINEINELLPIVDEMENYAVTYADSTYPSFVILEKPIEIKNQFVYVFYEDSRYNYVEGKQRYNLNKKGEFDEYGEVYLLQDLKIILKAFKKLIGGKNNDNN